MRMTPEEFEAEMRYQGLMFFVKQMLREGLITETEFEQIAVEYATKIYPKTGTLLVRNRLLSGRNRA